METQKPFYESKFVMSRVMNKGVLRACKDRLQILLNEQEDSFTKWKEQHRFLIKNKTTEKHVERNYYKRINALKVVIWMLSDYSQRTIDMPSLTTIRNRKEKKQPKLLPPSSTPEIQALNTDQITLLKNLADLLGKKIG